MCAEIGAKPCQLAILWERTRQGGGNTWPIREGLLENQGIKKVKNNEFQEEVLSIDTIISLNHKWA